MERLLTNLEIKSMDDKTGVFVGYGSTFGNIDDGRDVVEKGAFDESMEEHGKAGTMPGMFWSHQGNEPIGEWSSWKVDKTGLLMEGQLWTGKGIPKAEQAYLMLKSKGPKGLSIGYSIKEGGKRIDEKKQIRYLTKLGVGEVSPCPFPMNRKATIVAIKSDATFAFKNADGTLITIRDFERILRDGGLSESEAKTLLAGGYSRLVPRDGDKQSLLEALKKYTPTV